MGSAWTRPLGGEEPRRNLRMSPRSLGLFKELPLEGLSGETRARIASSQEPRGFDGPPPPPASRSGPAAGERWATKAVRIARKPCPPSRSSSAGRDPLPLNLCPASPGSRAQRQDRRSSEPPSRVCSRLGAAGSRPPPRARVSGFVRQGGPGGGGRGQQTRSFPGWEGPLSAEPGHANWNRRPRGIAGSRRPR